MSRLQRRRGGDHRPFRAASCTAILGTGLLLAFAWPLSRSHASNAPEGLPEAGFVRVWTATQGQGVFGQLLDGRVVRFDGQSWEGLFDERPHEIVHYVPGVDGAGSHLAATERALLRSDGGGASWKTASIASGPRCARVAGIVVDPGAKDHIFAASDSRVGCASGLWETVDGGATWEWIPTAQEGGAGLWPLVADPWRGGWLYSANPDTGFRYSRDFGRTWIDPNPEAGQLGGTVVLHPVVQDRLLLATADGILLSEDAGDTWTTVEAGSRATQIGFFGPNPEVAYAATLDGILRSNDGGGSWERVNEMGGLALATDSSSPETVYVASPGASAYLGRVTVPQFAAGIWVSRDGGEHFSRLGPEIRAQAKAIDAFPFRPAVTPGGIATSSSDPGLQGLIAAGGSGSFDVSSFGALCDGVEDDTSAIQAAVDAAALASGGTVVLPTGICRIDGTIQMASGTTLIGQGIGATFLRRGGINYPAPHFMVVFDGTEGASLQHLTIDGSRGLASEATGSLSGVELDSAREISLRSIQIKAQEGIGVVVNGTTTELANRVSILDARFDEVGGGALLLEGEWSDVLVADCTFADYEGVPIRHDGTGSSLPSTGLVVSGSRFTSQSPQVAIELDWVVRTNISQNVIAGGIELGEVGYATLEENVIRSDSAPGILVDDESGPLVVANNVVESAGDWGVRAPVAGGSLVGLSVVGNRFRSDVGGVFLSKGRDVLISSNSVVATSSGGTNHGLLVASDLSVENVSITNNVVRDSLTGIEVAVGQASFDTALVADNLIYSSVAGAQGIVIDGAISNALDGGNQSVEIELDTTPPTLAFVSPTNGSYVNTASPDLIVAFSDAQSGVDTESLAFFVDGVAAASSCTFGVDNATCQLTTPLAEGPAALTASIADLEGNVSPLAASTFTVDTIPPDAVDVLLVSAPEPTGGSTALAGSPGAAEGLTTLTVTNRSTSATTTTNVAADGSFALSVAAESGDVLELVLTDAAGNASPPALVFAAVPTACHEPPDPSLVADQSLLSNYDIFEHSRFLWEGDPAVQIGVLPDALQSETMALVRGFVFDREGNPLPGVSVSVLDRLEYGCTASRVDGSFDLAVTGGPAVLSFERDGYFSVQRRQDIAVRELTSLEQVILTALPATADALLLGASTVEVARGEVETDADGSRQATVLVPAGVTAELEMPDGSMVPAPNLTVRIKEFTVGDLGPDAMPGALPAASAYTYAFEAIADEAEAAGATSIVFSEPVFHYIENFLDFPAGTVVPVGFYDRKQGQWVASDDGVVIDIIGIDGAGLAELDVDDSGQAADAATLAGLGFTDAEREKLATLYSVGESLWRSPIPHLTPWDCNMAWRNSPEDAINPDPEVTVGGGEECNDQQSGSIIECQNQVIRESIPIAGTPFALHYSSERVAGREFDRILDIELTPDEVPESLQTVILEIKVAGQAHRFEYPPLPGLQHTFIWDGLDAYGRPVVGEVAVKGRVGFKYPYLITGGPGTGRSFGLPSASTLTRPSRDELIAWADFSTTLRSLNLGQDGGPLGLGWSGWSITPQHMHAVRRIAEGSLYFGDGSTYPSDQLTFREEFQFGGANVDYFKWENGGWVVANNTFLAVDSMTTDAAGNVYVSEGGGIYKFIPGDGTYRIAGGGGSTADDIPAVDASLNQPRRLDVGADGTLYFAEHFGGNRVRRIRPDGMIDTVFYVDRPAEVSVGPDGALYVVENEGWDSILKVDPDSGAAATFAGGTGDTCSDPERGDGGPATLACLRLHTTVMKLGWMADGSMLIPEGRTMNRIRRVAPSGTITTFMGDDTPGDPAYGLHYSNSRLDSPKMVDVDPVSGSILILDSGNRLSLIQPDGIIVPVDAPDARAMEYSIDGRMHWVNDPIFQPPARMYVREFSDFRDENGNFNIPSPDASAIYRFAPNGRHLDTVDAATGDLVYRFNYDGAERLQSIEDRYGLEMTVQRGGGGAPTALVAPHGQVTNVTVDGAGNLLSVVNPEGESYSMTYGEGGLLESITDPRDNTTSMTYDAAGLLLSEEDAKGATKTLTRTAGTTDYSVLFATEEGATANYHIQRNDDGSQDRTQTDPGNVVTLTHLKKNLGRTVTRPDGTVIDLELEDDPRFGTQSFVPQLQVVTPLGLVRTVTTTRTPTFVDPSGPQRDPANLETLLEEVDINGEVYSSLYTSATRTWQLTSPEGRTATTVLNAEGEVESVQRPGLHPVTMTYDTEGRLVETRMGVAPDERVTTYAYGTAGWLDSMTDAEQRTFGWQRDLVGRPLVTDYPDASQLDTGYDDNGNLIDLAPPGQPSHAFTYDDVDLPDTYQAPGNPAEDLDFNLDRQPITLTRPSGEVVTFEYDATRRLTKIDTTTDDHTMVYRSISNQLLSLSHWPQGSGIGTGQTLSFEYDGFLPTKTTWSGTVGGTVQHDYDDDFRVDKQTVYNGLVISYGYDLDSLLTQAGSLGIVRDPATGWIDTTTLGVIDTSQGYNGFGEMDSFEATVSAAPVYSASYVHDDLGRITEKTETIDGVTSVYVYEYETSGRLDKVWKDAALVEDYGYDANGNRTSYDGMFGPATGSYDSQDRLQTYGSRTYSFDADGDLTSVSSGGFQTTYDYDAMGSLRQVVLDTGVTIDYTVDGLNRRVGKSIGGVLVQGFLYQDQLNPVAELDGAGNVVSQFVYGTRGHVPDYMTKGGTTYRIVSDHLGSVRLVVNTSTGAIVQRMDYDSFGRVIFDDNPGFQPFGFAGGLYEPQTGLVRFGARDYEAVTGRWTAKDPIGFGGGDSNLYSYVGQDPVNLVDPSGEIVPLVVAGALVGGAVAGGLYGAFTDDFTWCGFWGAVAGGAIAGGVGVVATPIAASLGLGTAWTGAAIVNAGAGLTAAVATAAIDPGQPLSIAFLSTSAAFGGLGGALGGAAFPTTGMSNFRQVGFPRTWRGVTPRALGGTMGQNARRSVWQGGTLGTTVGFLGPSYVQ